MVFHDIEEFLQRNTCLCFALQQVHLPGWWANSHSSLRLQWLIDNRCRHNPLRATSGTKAKCHQKASNNRKAGRSVFSNTVLHNHPVLVPSRHPQRGLSAPTLLGIVLIMHMLFPQQLNYSSSDTLLEWWNDQNLLAKKWTQESDASKQRAMGHNQHGALGSGFFKMDLVVSMSFKEECHVWLGAGSLYLDKLSKEAWLSISPQNWSDLHPNNSAFRSLGDTKADMSYLCDLEWIINIL